MADTFSSTERSAIMKKVRSKKNKSTELRIIKFFKEKGIKGWRRNYNLFGNPDFVFPKLRIAVFTDGCFWHGHNCRNTKPESNKDYWSKKIEKNRNRDVVVNEKLSEKNWLVLRVWECELKKKNQDLLYEKLSILLKDSEED